MSNGLLRRGPTQLESPTKAQCAFRESISYSLETIWCNGMGGDERQLAPMSQLRYRKWLLRNNLGLKNQTPQPEKLEKGGDFTLEKERHSFPSLLKMVKNFFF
ncbi:hypothetical protein AVEN_239547-1 [Araneus ventricosus]|uniref:Uncharacterized protein n=1 Tax=Araneus ventricosus TaxID=182803 RepID=A0A4Y2HMA9_ARAVE|nr:hypothetical protein AVEN_239547-1 [Araneus ventricosus]